MRRFWCRLDRLLNRLYTICGYAAALFLVIIGLMVCASIVTRLFSTYVPGLTEYSGYAMAAASFLALAYTFQYDGHIRVDLVISRFATGTRYLFELWALLVASITCCYLAYYLARLVYFSYRFAERSEGSDAIMLWIPQSLVLVGGVVLAICCSHRLIKTLVSGRMQPGLEA